MNLQELRYFVVVAQFENLHRAAKELRVSPAAISKSIGRLEDELAVQLLTRRGRAISLTAAGTLLAKRASALLHFEEAVRLEITGGRTQLQVTLAGPEALLLRFGRKISQALLATYPDATFDYVTTTELRAIAQVENGAAHIAIISSPAPMGLTVTPLAELECSVCVGPGHPLHQAATIGTALAVDAILRHKFVVPSLALFGQWPADWALDGWRDDLLPRRVSFRSSCLKMVEHCVLSGDAMAYLPEVHATSIGAASLNVKDLPFPSALPVQMVTRSVEHLPWMRDVIAAV